MVLHQLGPRPTFFMPRWTAHPCILKQRHAKMSTLDPETTPFMDLNTTALVARKKSTQEAFNGNKLNI